MLTHDQLDVIRGLVLGPQHAASPLGAAGYSLAALVDDDAEARNQLALLRAGHAELLAAARAAVAAARDGAADPLVYLRGVLAKRGQLPPAGMRPPQILAAAGVVSP
jgi:hypothetical protein